MKNIVKETNRLKQMLATNNSLANVTVSIVQRTFLGCRGRIITFCVSACLLALCLPLSGGMLTKYFYVFAV